MHEGRADPSLPEETRQKLREAALNIFAAWDQSWPETQHEIESTGNRILCRSGCVPCCYRRVFCSLAEGVAIADYLREHFSPERQEYFRLRVESTTSSLRKLRADDCCHSEDLFYRAGGLECPFLEEGRCGIYEVRPLDCRALSVTTETNVDDCRRCPHAVVRIEAEAQCRRLQKQLGARERALGIVVSPPNGSRPLLPEVLSTLWESTPPASFRFSPNAWKLRLATRDTERDETWQDDRSDFRAVGLPVTLPEEGDYPQDLTFLRQSRKGHELYGRSVSGEDIPTFYTVYKRHRGCQFNWLTRRFQVEKTKSELPYTVWVSDDLQERLMAWEAAKRARGRVLCGGLGLGIFPQFALSLARVEAVDVVEKDPDIIALVSRAWEKQPWPRRSACRTIEMTIEQYLRETPETYDTVYLDTWDDLYHGYLPHLNELTHLARRVLRPQGEILLWGFDIMVRAFLHLVATVQEHREKYLAASVAQIENIKWLYPLLYGLVSWLQRHPESSADDLKSEGYRLATRERRNLGLLVLRNHPGAKPLLEQRYLRASKF